MNKLLSKIRRNKFDLDENEKKLAEIAIWMIENNPSLHIGGSLLLKMNGIDIKRKVHDIDLVSSDSNKDISEYECPENFEIYQDETVKHNVYSPYRFKSKSEEIFIDILFNENDGENDGKIFSDLSSLVDAKFLYLAKSLSSQQDKCIKDIFNILISPKAISLIEKSKYEEYIEELIEYIIKTEMWEEYALRTLFQRNLKLCKFNIFNYLLKKINNKF